MHHHPTDTKTALLAARHFGALRSALRTLKTYYRDLNSLSSSVPRDPKFPYPSHFTSPDSTKQYFRYVSHPIEDRLIFFGKLLDGGEDICIKFVQSYMKDAHAFCAAKGFAPALRGFEKLPRGWYMVVMDRVPDDYIHCFEVTHPTWELWHPLLDSVRKSIREMDEANIVHDELCNTDFLVKNTDSEVLFMLVDFSLSTRR
jgi:hypothetical protein